MGGTVLVKGRRRGGYGGWHVEWSKNFRPTHLSISYLLVSVGFWIRFAPFRCKRGRFCKFIFSLFIKKNFASHDRLSQLLKCLGAAMEMVLFDTHGLRATREKSCGVSRSGGRGVRS